jgi:hypothetical protein
MRTGFVVHPDPERSALSAKRGFPDTGWVHYRHKTGFLVVVSNDRRTLDGLHVPSTHVEQYGDDEPTIDFYDAWPMLKPSRGKAVGLHEWLRPFPEWLRSC